MRTIRRRQRGPSRAITRPRQAAAAPQRQQQQAPSAATTTTITTTTTTTTTTQSVSKENNGNFKFITQIYNAFSPSPPPLSLPQKTTMISSRVPTARTSFLTDTAVANSMRSLLHRVPGQTISVITIAKPQRQQRRAVSLVPRPHVDNA